MTIKPEFGNYRPEMFGWNKDDKRVPFVYKGHTFVGGVNAAPGVAALFTKALDVVVPHIPGGLVTGQLWGATDEDKVSDSFHLYGLALDLNAPENPQTSGPHPWGKEYELPSNTGTLIRPFGMEWGGNWTPETPPDYMHIEIHLSPAQVAKLAGETIVATPKPGSPANDGIEWGPYVKISPAHRTIEIGSRGTDVADLQRVLNEWYPHVTPPLIIDGDYGTATKSRTEYAQKRAGIAVDGITGPETWHALGYPVAY